MLSIYKDKEIEILFNDTPNIDIRYLLPWLSEIEKTSIKKKPFLNQRELSIVVKDLKNKECYEFAIPEGYCWNGASIPRIFWRIIGSNTDNDFLIASCIHDFMCENHEVIDDRRLLSSKIFRGLLISSGVSKIKAQTMFLTVDNFQKLCNWRNK